MSKAHRALLFTLLSIALPGVAWAQGAPPERKDVHLAVGGKAALYYLPLTVAEQLGYFKQEGLEVNIS
jgi:NitT/TauT family transport system substrate-binding protein